MTEKSKFRTHEPNAPQWLWREIVKPSLVADYLWAKGNSPGSVPHKLTSRMSYCMKGREVKKVSGETVRRYRQFTQDELNRLEEIRREYYPHLSAE
jgi:hypothetical protein